MAYKKNISALSDIHNSHHIKSAALSIASVGIIFGVVAAGVTVVTSTYVYKYHYDDITGMFTARKNNINKLVSKSSIESIKPLEEGILLHKICKKITDKDYFIHYSGL